MPHFRVAHLAPALAATLALAACSDGSQGSGGPAGCRPRATITPSPAATTPGTTTPGAIPTTTGTLPLPGLPLPGGPSGTIDASLKAETDFGPNPGGLSMYVYAPSSLRAGAPVVVALHGCTQSASAYVPAGWNDLANKLGFLVVYPEQTSANNAQRCFRWWDSAHASRDKGESASIAAMVQSARAKYKVGDAYVTGLSAGAAMTAALLANYPDVFKAGAIMSGMPYRCAESQVDAYSCMSGSKDQTAAAWGALLPAAASAHPPRVAIWHGDADYVVKTSNATQLVRQWTSAHHIAESAKQTEKVGPAEHTTYRDGSGNVAVESWIIGGMGHGVALDPKNHCGAAGAFLLDVALCSTERAASFFFSTTSSSSAAVPVTGGTAGPTCE